MLVIISDLHLTDGTSGTTIGQGAFRVFRQRLRDMAYDASWRLRPNGKVAYDPIQGMDILLLGDILDVIRSTKWGGQKNAARPWDYGQSTPKTNSVTQKVAQITDAILKHNHDSLAVLQSLSQGKQVTLPPAKNGEPDPAAGWAPDARDRKPVAVRLHYMVGNHDWFYHLPGKGFDQMRLKIKKALGLANDHREPFPHDPEESKGIASLQQDHAVLARHGDIYDSFNFENHRDASSLGDAIVIELLNRFPAAVQTALKGRLKGLPGYVVDGLREIDNVRPLLLVPVWIDGLLNRLCPDPKLIHGVKEIWNELVDGFLKLKFVKDRDSWLHPWDNVDKLQAALRFSKGFSLHTASQLLAWISESGFKSSDSYYEDALTEANFKNRTARFLVYGHTHHHEIVPLDVWHHPKQGHIEQLYLNSGTWRRVYRLARLNTKDEEFIGYNVLTYLAFYKNGERRGRPFEAWSGALAPPA